MKLYDRPGDYKQGQKVWFMGMKARVAEGMFQRWIEESHFNNWAVPIVIKGMGVVTLVHVEELTPRGHKK